MACLGPAEHIQALTYTTEPIIAAKGQTIQSISQVSGVNRNGRPESGWKLQIPEKLRVSAAV